MIYGIFLNEGILESLGFLTRESPSRAKPGPLRGFVIFAGLLSSGTPKST